MVGMVDAERGAGRRPVPAATDEGLLTFDAGLRVGLVDGRAAALLGLPRWGRQPRGLHDLLGASPRIDREALAALTAACLTATLPEGRAQEWLRLPGAPGLRFAIRSAGGASWMLVVAAGMRLAGGAPGFDPLTGLADRPMFEARLAAALDGPARRRVGCAVLLCDIDGLGAVNRSLGHATGEDLLRAAARRLQAAVRDADLVARLAGEEFGLLQSEVEEPAQALALGDRLVGLLGRPYLIGGEIIVVTPRIGIAVAPVDGTVGADLLRRAAMARNVATPGGHGGVHRL